MAIFFHNIQIKNKWLWHLKWLSQHYESYSCIGVMLHATDNTCKKCVKWNAFSFYSVVKLFYECQLFDFAIWFLCQIINANYRYTCKILQAKSASASRHTKSIVMGASQAIQVHVCIKFRCPRSNNSPKALGKDWFYGQ